VGYDKVIDAEIAFTDYTATVDQAENIFPEIIRMFSSVNY
jgi:hypothetical protein